MKILIKTIPFVLFFLFIGCREEWSAVQASPTVLIVKKVPLTVGNKTTEVFRIEQPDGTWGFQGIQGEDFNTIVKNETNVPTVIHWHGLIVPNDADGVPNMTQPAIPPGGEYPYHFKLTQSGTYWMHSHYGLQTERYLSAPFIIHEAQEKDANTQEVVMFITDYSHKSPETILKELKSKSSMQMSSKPDLTDVTYDALLTNYKTLQDPEIIKVKPEQTVRLRLINAASGSNVFIKTGDLKGTVIATDGQPIHPFSGTKFPLAVAQRLDILVTIPKQGGAYPILAQGEGTQLQTGLILATPEASIPSLNEQAKTVEDALNYDQERQYKAVTPLSVKKPEQTLLASLDGNMKNYVWMINNQAWPNVTPLEANPFKRVEIVFKNTTGMSHPMHLHGHTFEVTEIDGQPLHNGPMRDTVLVMPHSTVKIQFDSNNPGNWPLHCHLAYHQAAGMMTFVNYKGIQIPQLKSLE
jgi:FtsP/CotA-like multicopper oxidase with cupredoxin domain